MNQKRKKGSNILLHDGGQADLGVDRGRTLEATRMMLESWPQEEHEFVTIEKWVSEASELTGRF
jgi:hypothetical protein